MSSSSDFAAGAAQRALCDLTLWRYAWQALEVSQQVLRRDALFQPWRRHGHRVLVSLGDASTEPEWSAAQPHALFLRHADFVRCCQVASLPLPARSVGPLDQPPYPGAFDELPGIVERLHVAPDVAAQLTQLAAEYTAGADFERAASGFDNTAAMRAGRDRMERALSAALLHGQR